MEKKIAFMSTGCQTNFGRPREIIASIPELVEVDKADNPDYIMANFCAISSENIEVFNALKRELLQMKKANPSLKILAGGCIEGLNVKKDLSFADAIYHHQEEKTAFLHFLGYDSVPNPQPAIIYDVAFIVIAQGCNRRCTFCKVHYLNYMKLTSRPVDEIVALAHAALAQGVHNLCLNAENSTEYGCDIGTNLCELLQALFAIEGIRYIDITGLCLDEISPKLLELLKNPKIRQLQVEVQSLYDPVRKAMGLNKTRDEALAILNALRNKALTSNFISGFPNSNIKEFDKELRLIREHHLYFLNHSPYDDTEGTPSHQIYKKIPKSESLYYEEAFMATVANERQLLLENLMAKDSIEATVAIESENNYTLIPTNYMLKVTARKDNHTYQVGDVVHVKITGLRQFIPKAKQRDFLAKLDMRSPGNSTRHAAILQNLQYFGGYDQIMMVRGTITA